MRASSSTGRTRQRDDRVARPWICFAGQDWWYHNRAHSDFQLMIRVARSRQVLVVNSIGLRMPVPGRSSQALGRILRKLRSLAHLVRRPLDDVPGFAVMTPLVVPLYQYPLVRRLNAALVRAQVQLVARRLGITRPVVMATLPTAGDVIAGMDTAAVIYNRSDRLSEYPEGDQETLRGLERDFLARADRVLYVSHALMELDGPDVGSRGVFLDHGVDLTHFRRRPEHEQPEELRALPRPRIGFFGAIDDYVVDIDLLERVAAEIPEAQLVLIGAATCPMDRFDRYPNVHVLGFRPYEEIPRYGSGFDVAIMPWVDSEWIRLCNPIKLKEYLALGLPVVSMRYPEIAAYTGVVDVADDADEFVALLRRALSATTGDDTGPRRDAVLDAGWDRRAEELVALADELSPGRS